MQYKTQTIQEDFFLGGAGGKEMMSRLHLNKARLVVVQSLSCVRLFVTPWTATHQASLPITNSQSLLKLMSIESVMSSTHLILCHPLLPPSIVPSIRVFFSDSTLHISWPILELQFQLQSFQ